jgi:hypothetical protein
MDLIIYVLAFIGLCWIVNTLAKLALGFIR